MGRDEAPSLASLPFFRRQHGLTIREGPGDTVPFALFEGRIPNPRECRAIARHGYGLHLLLSIGVDDGARIVEMLPGLTRLSVTGIDLELAWLARLRELENLAIYGTIRQQPDLSSSQSLTTFAGALAGMESALKARTLKAADLYEVRAGALPTIPAQLKTLRLTDLQGTRRLDTDVRASELTRIGLIGSRLFDAECLQAFSSLQEIELDQVATMTNIDALTRLPNLTTLSLGRCRDLTPIESLLELPGVSIYVWGRGTFAAKMKDLASGSDNWTFH